MHAWQFVWTYERAGRSGPTVMLPISVSYLAWRRASEGAFPYFPFSALCLPSLLFISPSFSHFRLVWFGMVWYACGTIFSPRVQTQNARSSLDARI